MAFKIADRVREISTTTGAGSLTLGGAALGFQTFDSALDTGDITWYAIAFGADFEVGLGTFTAPATLARTQVLASSNGGSAVSFGAGEKDVFVTAPALALALLRSDGNLAALAGLTSAANKMPYFTGPGAAALADLTPAARTFMAAADVASQRAALGGEYVIQRDAATAASFIDMSLPSSFDMFELDIVGFYGSGLSSLSLRVSLDGTTFDAGGSDYGNTVNYAFASSQATYAPSGSSMIVAPDASASFHTAAGKLLIDAGAAGRRCTVDGRSGANSSSLAAAVMYNTNGYRLTPGRVQKIRLFTSGTTNGVFILKGLGA